MSVTNNRTSNGNNTQSSFAVAISMLLNKMKKYLAIWIAAAVMIGILSLLYSVITTQVNKPELKALIGFSYDGIDNGLDPKGRKFDINGVKSPAVIEMALTELNIDISKLEDIRNGIVFEKIIPSGAYDKFTVYNSILEKGGGNSLDAGEKLLETSYYPTQFTVYFDYSNTGFSTNEAVNVFNMILEKYNDFFYKSYGYNESLGVAVSSITYSDYDYAEAVDVFDNSLEILKKYVKNLANEDDTRFRSSATGYTFDDLYTSIDTIQTIDLSNISSYVVANNVTKDKSRSITYCEYQIDSLTRKKANYEKQIAAYEKSIETYEKDQLIVFGNTEENNTQTSISSEEYDNMFREKNSVSVELAGIEEKLEYFTKRLSALKNSSNNSKVNIDTVESELSSLNEKVNNLIDMVSDTSEDYYKNVTFGNAYNILVPASGSSINKFKVIFENAKTPLVVFEAIAFFIYFSAAYVTAFLGVKTNLSISESSDENKKSEKK